MTPESIHPLRPPRAGFALVEALVSLLIVALALLFAISLLVADVRVRDRLVAQREVLAVEEALLETFRSGRLTPASRQLEQVEIALLLGRNVRPMTVWLEVTPEPQAPGLYAVRVDAVYRAGRESQRRVLDTKVWRRGGIR